jgi:hypothetical protein
LASKSFFSLDTNGDGTLGFKEFLPYFEKSTVDLKAKFLKTKYDVYAWGNTDLDIATYK